LLILAFRSFRHHHFITLGNNGDQKVQQNDEDDELVQEPNQPNDRFHKFGVKGVATQIFSSPVNPF
jgi:hypothetical protein